MLRHTAFDRLLLTLALALLCVSSARADESSGTWTGSLEGRGNYYWENSTRVVVPEIELKLVTPGGLRMGVGELVDVISSASIAQTGSDEDSVFVEYRHGVHAEVGKEFELGSIQIDPHAHLTFSTEDDYTSWIYGLGVDFSFDERNHKLSLGVTLVNDSIEANNDASFQGELNGITGSIGYERVINTRMVLTLSYDLGLLEGFLGNAYRRVLFTQGAPVREAPPPTRLRHNAAARVSFIIPESGTAVQLAYRAYIDSWDIAALTPELRVIQEVGENLLVRAHYRFNAQTAASFIERDGRYDGSGTTYGGATSNDPKLAEIETHTFGGGLEYRLHFLADTFLDFASNATIDVNVDRYLSTSTFGNGIIASAGGRLPF